MTDSGNVRRLPSPVNPDRPTRRERAQATRARVVDAAHELFTTRGYTGTRMTDVAAAAGVAVQTVYFTFHTKPELLRACYTRAVTGDDALAPRDQPWYATMLEAPTAREALRQFSAGNTAITARVGLLDDVVRSAAHEPDAAAVRTHSEQLRRDGYRTVIDHLAARFGLREGLDPEAATDILLTLGGAATYRSLVLEYGWSDDAFVGWLTDTLLAALAPTAPPVASAP